MRVLVFHVDHFECTATQKGRSTLVEPLSAPSYRLEDGLLVLASAEPGDEAGGQAVAELAAAELGRLAQRVGARRFLIHPFAHLFGRPCAAADAVAALDRTVAELRKNGFEANRTPFGWFYAWELRAKGHPLSRVGRRIRGPRSSG